VTRIKTDARTKRYALMTGGELASYGELSAGDYLATSLDVIESEDDNVFLEAVQASAFPELPESGWLEEGAIYNYEEQSVIVRQPHTNYDPTHTPDITPNLWVRFYAPEAGPQPWTQPAGAHDAYQTGDRVTYNGYVWESVADNNVWAPGVYGWVQIEAV